MDAPCAFDTDLLDPAPEDFELFGGSDIVREHDRALNVGAYQRIVKYHTWGLKYTIVGRKTKAKLFALLKKIVFNQQPHLRAKNWRSFILCNCDAGPGLLELRYNAPRITLRNCTGAITGTSGLPPFKAATPQLLPRPLRQQPVQGISQPTSSLGRISPYPQQKQTLTAGENPRPPATQRAFSHSAGFQGVNQSNRKPSHTLANVSPNSAYSAFTNEGSGLPSFPDLPEVEMTAGADFDRSMGDLPQNSREVSNAEHPVVDDPGKRHIVEAIEREAMRIAYRGVERHPSAFPIGACPTSTAESSQSFSNSLVFSRSTRQLRLTRNDSGLVSRFDPNGALYTYRGRGPITRHVNSSSVDCIIVAGKLLDAGSTRNDRGDDEDWEASLTIYEEAFLEATTLEWDVFSDNTSVESRDDFWKLLNGGLSYLDRQFVFGQSLPPTALWDICTTSFHQFKLAYEESIAICPCRNTTGELPSKMLSVSSIAPKFEESDRLGVTMQGLLDRFFKRLEKRTCPTCRSDTDIVFRQFGELPLRLVVKPDPRVLLRHHTSNKVFFKYFDLKNFEMVGTYRWLGGIYRAPTPEDRYAIFWTDDKRGEPVTGDLCMYDGTQNSGAIVGGIPPSSQEERVPSVWWDHGRVPLLFYERVINPSLDTLTTARDAVSRMIRTVNNKKLILEDHQPWTKSGVPSNVKPRRRRYLNGSPNTSEFNTSSEAVANRRRTITLENNHISSEQGVMISSGKHPEMQVANERREIEHVVPKARPSEEQIQVQSNPCANLDMQARTQAELGTNNNSRLAGELQDVLGPEHVRTPLPQGQQLVNLENRVNNTIQPIPDSPRRAALQNLSPLTDVDIHMLWQQMNTDIPFRPADNSKRPRSPSTTSPDEAGSFSPKKRRCE